ncbi:MAG: hypothetical protein RBT34_12755 [Anaerolineaceae bacterium]|jgi:preprotein translocase subunit SecA|nr:hypothetical protein [Anaerolineaceae bacterium]
MFKKLGKILGGDPTKRALDEIAQTVDLINALENTYEKLPDDALRAKTAEFRQRLKDGETLDDILVEAFAVVREVSKRTIGLRHYDVQMIGGIVLHRGQIAEMRTGEGKTLVATLPLYLNGLTGRGVHLVTVNDYLARRDARWMAPIFNFLGLTIGVLQMAARTENGQKAFLIDMEKTSAQEDQHQLVMVSRGEAYQADLTYGTNSEFGFDYLRDNLSRSKKERVQRGHTYCIIDEVDNVLIDEARTPLIISGPASDESEMYHQMAQVVRQLNPEDYEIEERDRQVNLTEVGEAHVEELLNTPLRDPERPEDITPEQARILGHLEQALRAEFLYRRNKEYLKIGNQIVIVDEFTGRQMPGRRWSEGLHQAVEAKEGVEIHPENVTYATITIQNYFRMYEKLAGMTGTALTEAEEFAKIYELEVLPIPTNLDYLAEREDTDLIALKDKDEYGYEFVYYTREGEAQKHPLFWKRKDYPDVVYRTAEAKLRAIIQEVIRFHVIGRPQLVGTTSVEHSDLLSNRLSTASVRQLMQVILVRQAWLEANNQDMFDRIPPELKPLNEPLEKLQTHQIKQAIKESGLELSSLDPAHAGNLPLLLRALNLHPEHAERLEAAIRSGVPHKVLNARKHDTEALVIAGAGAFGAVTIATNMAGRGVDIKLGGELYEEIIQDINTHVLNGIVDDPFTMNHEQRRAALQQVDDYGIYEEQVNTYLDYVDKMGKVRELGGLHVIGTERHEARRIDNQLRGRAARQGDPGSSRFYLSLEDDLMRLFGGQQVEAIWGRMALDDSLPIEIRMLGRIVEQSQERVEGNNFDIRKHLLEYDDVLNSQRQRIYDQRDQIFEKKDLSEDILDMLQRELQERLLTALADEEGPWKLLSYLNEVQPPIQYEDIGYPSFTYRLLIDEIHTRAGANPGPATLKAALLTLAENALLSEREHLLKLAGVTITAIEEKLNARLEEAEETIDLFIEGLELNDPDEPQPVRSPQELQSEMSTLLHVTLKLPQEQLRKLMDGEGDTVREDILDQVQEQLTILNVRRLYGALERTLGKGSLKTSLDQINTSDWQEATDQMLQAVEDLFEQRLKRLIGQQGEIAADLDKALKELGSDPLADPALIQLLSLMSVGTRLGFDQKTHKRIQLRYHRLNYIFLAAHLIEISQPEAISERVIQHLEQALGVLEEIRGRFQWNQLIKVNATLGQLDESLQNQLKTSLGEEKFTSLTGMTLFEFNEEDRQMVSEVLGRRLQNDAYRQLLLHVISNQWVEYLTEVEALRIQVGMERYGQRDPLVQYKSKATDMFKQLLKNIRLAVVSQAFTFRPRAVAVEGSAPASGPAVAPASQQAPQSTAKRKKKRKRH